MKIKTSVKGLNRIGIISIICFIVGIIGSILLVCILPMSLVLLMVLIIPGGAFLIISVAVLFCNSEDICFDDIDKKGEIYILRQEGGWGDTIFEYTLAIKRPFCYLIRRGAYFNTIESAMDYIVKLREEEKEKERKRHPCISCVGKEGSI